MSTIDVLDKLTAETPDHDPIFKTEFERAIVSFLLDFPQWTPLELLKPDFFSDKIVSFVVAGSHAEHLRKLRNYLSVHGPASATKTRTALGWNPEKLQKVVALSGGQIEEFQEGGRRLFRVAEAGEETATETAPTE